MYSPWNSQYHENSEMYTLSDYNSSWKAPYSVRLQCISAVHSWRPRLTKELNFWSSLLRAKITHVVAIFNTQQGVFTPFLSK